jgi:serine/threonine protein kinase
MHSLGYAHLDLKHENIMIDGELNAKIGDFAFTVKCNDDGNTTSRQCTKRYAAPEVLYYVGPYSGEKADMYSLGVILFSAMFYKWVPDDYQ